MRCKALVANVNLASWIDREQQHVRQIRFHVSQLFLLLTQMFSACERDMYCE